MGNQLMKNGSFNQWRSNLIKATIELMNKRVNERMNERVCEWTNEWMNKTEIQL